MWIQEDNKLNRNFAFDNYAHALEFVNRISVSIEKLGHHPEILLTWGKVSISTTTHDTGNTITAKDHELTKYIDTCYE